MKIFVGSLEREMNGLCFWDVATELLSEEEERETD